MSADIFARLQLRETTTHMLRLTHVYIEFIIACSFSIARLGFLDLQVRIPIHSPTVNSHNYTSQHFKLRVSNPTSKCQ